MKKILFLLIFFSFYAYSQNYNSAQKVIEEMQKKYQGKWYVNLVFDQTAFLYENDSIISIETWHEFLSCPGKLHIRKGSFTSGNGMLFVNDSLYEFQNNVMVNKIKKYHDLLFWGFDVYFLDEDMIFTKAKEMQYDLSKLYETKWKDKAVYVIGSLEGEDTYNQFWIDKENLYLVRLIKQDGSKIKDVEFNNYQCINKKWIATEIIFKISGKLYMKEIYYNVQFPENADQKLFEVNNFKNANW